ncbi:MAG TPA: phosphotransferase [Gaiellaceae bacterium]|nr:phosphotransferase [Gaiellaceae bacterium]
MATDEHTWTKPDWLAEVRAWIDERVDVAGEVEQPHVRPWGTALRVPTTDGTHWFKANSPIHRFEVGLTRLLAGLRPERVTEFIDGDDERGWMLMRDAGIRLREVPASVEHFERVLPLYAELQMAATPYAEQMLELGVPDTRLAGLVCSLEPWAAQHSALDLQEVKALVEHLRTGGILDSIQHDDLHDGQIFVRDGHYRILDWGDSCVSHPFHSLTVTLRAATWKLELEPGSREVLRMRDAYLEPWGAPSELAPLADAAYRTGTLARALAWQRYIDAGEEESEAVLSGVKLFVENGPIGRW